MEPEGSTPNSQELSTCPYPEPDQSSPPHPTPPLQEYRLGVFESRVLSRIFRPTRDEVTGEWRKLHNEKFHDLYSLPSIVRIIKARRMRWAGHVARMEEKSNAYKLLMA
jgi:hypothetical protein